MPSNYHTCYCARCDSATSMRSTGPHARSLGCYVARRAGPFERTAGRIWREARATVATNVSLRDLNLDVRNIEVVANNPEGVDNRDRKPSVPDGETRPQADRDRTTAPAAASWSCCELSWAGASAAAP